MKWLFITALVFVSQIGAGETPSPDVPHCLRIAAYNSLHDVTELRDLKLNKRAIDAFLADRGKPITPVTFVVDGKKYQATRKLGKSANEVFLGVDESGKAVVIKKMEPVEEWLRDYIRNYNYLIDYEHLVTEYYLEMGLDVPKIIASDVSQGVTVKEYQPGLTVEDFFQHREKFVTGRYDPGIINSSLEAEQRRIAVIHAGFRDWLAANHPEISKKNLNRMRDQIDMGDLKHQNFVLDPRKGRWILFDP